MREHELVAFKVKGTECVGQDDGYTDKKVRTEMGMEGRLGVLYPR